VKIKRIYIKDWVELKPYDSHSITDNYYLKICNEVKKVLFLEYGEVLAYYLNENDIDLLSCFLVSYFEDVVSETNIFTAFTNKHQNLYGEKLPFYNTTEYYEDEINIQDIQFLIWYFLNTIQDEQFVNPNKEVFYKIANDIMLILEDEYEYAPENIVLKKYYTLPKNETDFYKGREMIDAVLFRSYFFHTDTYSILLERENKIIDTSKNNENLLSYLRDNRDTVLLSAHTKLLSLSGKEWVAEIIGDKYSLYKDFKNISPKIKGYFFYKGQDKDTVFLEHIASSKKFNLTKKSFDNAHLLTDIDTIVFMGIVLWKDEWWFSGIFFTQDFNADLILDEKNSIESRRMVNFLDHKDDEVIKTLQLQYQAFLDFNNGKQIAFLPADKVNDFTKEYVAFFNNSLKLSKKEIQKAKDRSKKEGFFGGDNDDDLEFDDSFETALVFFNPKSGLEIAFEVNSAFPFKENKYFYKDKTKEHILRLFMSEELSTELTLFCVDNFKSELSFFQKDEGKFLLNDLDFLLRFFKGSQYHTKPQITFTGSDNG
jgi:hypothetical protein